MPLAVRSIPESVCLYGAGELGHLAVDYCETCGINVAAVVDKSDESILINTRSGSTYKSITLDQYLHLV